MNQANRIIAFEKYSPKSSELSDSAHAPLPTKEPAGLYRLSSLLIRENADYDIMHAKRTISVGPPKQSRSLGAVADISEVHMRVDLMPIRDRIIWGENSPFSDPRLNGLDVLIQGIRRHGRLPQGVTGGSVFQNLDGDLPARPPSYYHEYDVQPPAAAGRGKLRIVLGNGGEVYITGNHYRDFRQIINMPQ